jgi:hypothetical protein
MSNKIHGFIRKLLRNSRLNRENFAKNKKAYNENKVYNKMITRRTHTYIIKRPDSFGLFGCGGGGPKPSLLLFILTTISIGIYNNQKK